MPENFDTDDSSGTDEDIPKPEEQQLDETAMRGTNQSFTLKNPTPSETSAALQQAMAERNKTDDYQDLIKPRKYIIAHDSKANFMWNIVIILSAIYLSILLPMKIAWAVIEDFVN